MYVGIIGHSSWLHILWSYHRPIERVTELRSLKLGPRPKMRAVMLRVPTGGESGRQDLVQETTAKAPEIQRRMCTRDPGIRAYLIRKPARL